MTVVHAHFTTLWCTQGFWTKFERKISHTRLYVACKCSSLPRRSIFRKRFSSATIVLAYVRRTTLSCMFREQNALQPFRRITLSYALVRLIRKATCLVLWLIFPLGLPLTRANIIGSGETVRMYNLYNGMTVVDPWHITLRHMNGFRSSLINIILCPSRSNVRRKAPCLQGQCHIRMYYLWTHEDVVYQRLWLFLYILFYYLTFVIEFYGPVIQLGSFKPVSSTNHTFPGQA